MIHKKKLNFLHHLRTMEDNSLASEILVLQIKYGFPGLVTECRELLQVYKLPNIIDENLNLSKFQWKSLVRKAIKIKSEETIKKTFQSFSKLRNKDFENKSLEIKDYVTNMKLRDERTYFRIRGDMIKAKMNMKHNSN